MIFGARNLKIIIIRQIRQLVAGTYTTTGRGRIISEKETDKPEMGLGKKTNQEEPR